MPELPPVMSSLVTAGDPFTDAVAAARAGCDAGLILHRVSETALDAAMVLAPETPLDQAVTVTMAAEVGYADAFGAVAPPQIGLHIEWPGIFRVNWGRCGRLRAASSTLQHDAVPDWLVLSLCVPFAPAAAGEPGHRPDETCLAEEGVTDVTPDELLSAWARHTLFWINAWEDGGFSRLHGERHARVWGMGETVRLELPRQCRSGIVIGLDERGGILLKEGETTHLIPLIETLEQR